VSLDDPEHLKEIFSAFGPVSVRRMFGGAGVYAEGTMFALVADGELYLKADADTIPAFRAAGVGPFVYGAKGRRVVMSYWRLPDRLLDEPDELAEWARTALRVAQRSAAARPSRRKAAVRKPNGRRH
jgi:DNA transformation protein and related proteins